MIRKNKDINFLQKIVEAYSPYSQERGVAKIIHKELDERGFEACFDRAGNVIGEIGRGQKQILFVGHMDVYQGGIPVRIEHGQLFGRGAVDAKGSIAAFISAVSRLKKKDLREKKVIVACCVEEEGPSSKGARYLMKKSGYKPDFVIIGEPSGWENITIGYRGVISFGAHFEQDNFHYGSNGDRVTDMAVRFCKSLLDKIVPYRGEANFSSPSVEIREINSENDGIREECDVQVVVRTPLDFNNEKLREWIKNSPRAKIKFTQSDPAVLSDFNTGLVRIFRLVIKGHQGRAALVKKLGTSDMNIIAPFYNVPTIAYGPGDSKLDHTPQEHIKLSEYLKSIDILAEVLGLL